MQERTEWHRVVIFNENLGRIAQQYLRKGSKVYIEGQLQTRKWQDQSGQDKYSTEIILQGYNSTLKMLYNRATNDLSGQNLEPIKNDSSNTQNDLDDEIPF